MNKLLFKVKNLDSIVKDIYTQIDLVQHDIIVLGKLRSNYVSSSRRYNSLTFRIKSLGEYRKFLFDMIKNYNHLEVK